MSLYHEAAEILHKVKKDGGSLKSAVFGKKTWKTDSKTLFALAVEAAKWSQILSEVVERSGVLKIERNLTPTLALLLTHDLLLAKKGVALPAKHGLAMAVSRHKARLSAELTKARIRRGMPSIDALRELVNAGALAVEQDDSIAVDAAPKFRHPRWVRINTLQTTLTDELATTFVHYTRVDSLEEVMTAGPGKNLLFIDHHIPNLLAIAGSDEPAKFKAYKTGKLIFQEKASCFPAYLLNPNPETDKHVIDTCAAPGNKTTHVAAILHEHASSLQQANADARVTACEKDPLRSETLAKMVQLAGGNSIITVKKKQDFLRLDPASKEFKDVSALLLDPSCSGSGIVGRDEVAVTVCLPSLTSQHDEAAAPKGKKRKRGGAKAVAAQPPTVSGGGTSAQKDDDGEAGEGEMTTIEEETPEEAPKDDDDRTKLAARLHSLSTFQLRLLQHAMAFPAARRITYSTCSVHAEENEVVVVRALASAVAQAAGWRILTRADQVDGLRRWHKRGDAQATKAAIEDVACSYEDGTLPHDAATINEACIRCDKGGSDGTMGFFVAGFVRDGSSTATISAKKKPKPAREKKTATEKNVTDGTKEEEEWGGFDD